MKRSSGGLRCASMAASRFATLRDSAEPFLVREPQPSQPRIRSAWRPRRKMSAGLRTSPSS